MMKKKKKKNTVEIWNQISYAVNINMIQTNAVPSKNTEGN
jgi:hypothetical protein